MPSSLYKLKELLIYIYIVSENDSNFDNIRCSLFHLQTLMNWPVLLWFIWHVSWLVCSKHSSRADSRPGSAHSLTLDGGDTRERPRTATQGARRPGIVTETKPGLYKETLLFG